MIEHRPFDAPGGAKTDWLHAKLHFSFAGLGRPEQGLLGALRVWNDDEFVPVFSGFALHPHKNVEIVTYEHVVASCRNVAGNRRFLTGTAKLTRSSCWRHGHAALLDQGTDPQRR